MPKHVAGLWEKFNESQTLEMKMFFYQQTFNLGFAEDAAKMYNEILKLLPNNYETNKDMYDI